MRDDFRAEGEVRLLGAMVGGNLDCDGGIFLNEGEDAISADGLQVDGSVFLRNGFQAKGLVNFTAAVVKRHFIWSGVLDPQYIELILESARIGTLWDEETSWPDRGKLHLSGLCYDDIYKKAPFTAKERIDWLRRQDDFRTSRTSTWRRFSENTVWTTTPKEYL